MMKLSTFALSSIILGTTLLVSGCGGSSTAGSSGSDGPGMGIISGNVSGLPENLTVLLVDNGSDTIGVNANGNFAFDKNIPPGSSYSVTLFTQPTGAYCTIANGSGTIVQNGGNVSNISVSCQPAAVGLMNYNVGVTVSGLAAGKSVTFLNNGKDTLTANANGLFVFPEIYSLESATLGQALGSYSVTVSADPAGQTCTLANGVGVASSNFVNLVATCQ